MYGLASQQTRPIGWSIRQVCVYINNNCEYAITCNSLFFYIHALKVHFKRCNNYHCTNFLSLAFHPFLLTSCCVNHDVRSQRWVRSCINFNTLLFSCCLYQRVCYFLLPFFVEMDTVITMQRTSYINCSNNSRSKCISLSFQFNSLTFFMYNFTHTYTFFFWKKKILFSLFIPSFDGQPKCHRSVGSACILRSFIDVRLLVSCVCFLKQTKISVSAFFFSCCTCSYVYKRRPNGKNESDCMHA